MESAEHSVNNETTADVQKTQELNSADRATRETISKYEKNWFEGPDFLKQFPESWPQDDGVHDADTREMKKEFISLISVKNNLPLPDVMRFSSWCKLVRCTAKVLKFIRRCQEKDVCIEVSADELREAERLSKTIVFQKNSIE
ncbi:hypothetical protein JTB14_018311 [Gonioctena quinquepunctata]|nr:hypothetical protein JTB14_018311 [Gonioctena quinquepunctata]